MKGGEGNCEVKVMMKNEKTQDAGGLTREWLGMLVKELCFRENGLTVRC